MDGEDLAFMDRHLVEKELKGLRKRICEEVYCDLLRNF